MKLQVLKYFTVLAVELHFGRAAAQLSITQPPLSTAIMSLEEELGVLLFERNRARVRLTPAGAAFLVEARKLLEGVARAKSVVKAVHEGMEGRIDVGFGGTLIFRDILKIVDLFKAQMPRVDIVLHEMQTSEQYDRLTRGQLDAGFVHGAATPENLRAITLAEDFFALCVHADHPMAHRKRIHLSEVANEPFIMFERDINPVNHDSVIAMFSQAGIYPKFVHYTRYWVTSVTMVSEGGGIAIVPSSLERMKMADVRFVPIEGEHVPARGMLSWNPSMVSPALEKFLESAEQAIKCQTSQNRARRPRALVEGASHGKSPGRRKAR
jgi:DNA-binding transcriptional LysR family regulator